MAPIRSNLIVGTLITIAEARILVVKKCQGLNMLDGVPTIEEKKTLEEPDED